MNSHAVLRLVGIYQRNHSENSARIMTYRYIITQPPFSLRFLWCVPAKGPSEVIVGATTIAFGVVITRPFTCSIIIKTNPENNTISYLSFPMGVSEQALRTFHSFAGV